jgi:hypothetical protein
MTPRAEEGGPGPRREVQHPGTEPEHPPHVTKNDRGARLQGSTPAPDDVPALPANAHGRDAVRAHEEVDEVDEASMYDRRPGEDKDRKETDMP